MIAEYFLYPQWIPLLAVAIPLILLYIIRSKPRSQAIPSLMFLIKDKGKKNFLHFFQRFIRHPLLFLHLLIFLVLVLALAQPAIYAPFLAQSQDVIIVLDNGARMHAEDSGETRYMQARNAARESLGARNTLVLMGALPEIVFESGNQRQVDDYLRTWVPSHQGVNIRAALTSIESRVTEGTTVHIISSFLDSIHQDEYADVLATIQSRGGSIEFHVIGTNDLAPVGIVDLQPGDIQTSLTIQNFGSETRTIEGCLNEACSEYVLEGNERRTVRFQTPPGVSSFEIRTDTVFPIDNKVYISSEESRTISTLVITNAAFENTPLSLALRAIAASSNVEFAITINNPPSIPAIDHELIIFTDIHPDTVVERVFRDVEHAVRRGAGVIIHSQDELFSLPFGALLYGTFEDFRNPVPAINTVQTSGFAGIDFQIVPRHLIISAPREAQVLATTAQQEPLIYIRALEQGRILYYGIPQTSSFSQSPDYPLFWREGIRSVTQRRGTAELTRRTGDIIQTTETIRDPKGQTLSGRVVLDTVGIYRTPTRNIAVNLVNERESSLRIGEIEFSTAQQLHIQQEQEQTSITQYLLFLVLFLLCMELIYIKWRGDV